MKKSMDALSAEMDSLRLFVIIQQFKFLHESKNESTCFVQQSMFDGLLVKNTHCNTKLAKTFPVLVIKDIMKKSWTQPKNVNHEFPSLVAA